MCVLDRDAYLAGKQAGSRDIHPSANHGKHAAHKRQARSCNPTPSSPPCIVTSMKTPCQVLVPSDTKELMHSLFNMQPLWQLHRGYDPDVCSQPPRFPEALPARSGRAGSRQVHARLGLEMVVPLISCSVPNCCCMAEALYLSPQDLESCSFEPF